MIPVSRAAIVLIALSAGVGCAEIEIPPPSADVRRHLGTIGVVAIPAREVSEPEAPVMGTGSGALMGAGQGAAGSVATLGYGGCQSGGPFGCALGLALGIVLAPPAALIGSAVGASRAHPEEEVRAADASLRAALAEVRPHERLRDRVIAVMRERTAYTLLDCSKAKQGAGYGTLAAEDVDTVLELDLTGFRVESLGRIDPDLTIRIDAHARLVGTAENREVYRRGWRYKSHERGYFDMAAEDAEPFRAGVREGFEMLANKIWYDLFVATAPEETGQERAGSVWTLEPPKTAEAGAAKIFEIETAPLAPETETAGANVSRACQSPSAGESRYQGSLKFKNRLLYSRKSRLTAFSSSAVLALWNRSL